MAEFDFIPVSPLIGSRMGNYLKAIRSGRVETRYLHKVLLTGLVIGIATPFHWYESLRQVKNRPLKRSPIFIIGHWRSGTTFLHNLLCQAPGAGYITTYQSIFPNNLHSKWLFKTFVNLNIPEKRPTDNVKLGSNLPQEDEFALENLNSPSFYNFFYFPDEVENCLKRSVLFGGRSEDEIKSWQETYHGLLLKGENNTKGDHMIIKNPSNTGRIDQLLKLYPDAKFIHIYRNPVMVYLSTKRFFEALFPSLYLHRVEKDKIREIVFDLYPKLMNRYLEQKSLIPKENLIDLKFEEFEKSPLDYTMQIHHQFGLGKNNESREAYIRYLEAQKGYKKSTHKIAKADIERIEKEWAFAFDKFNYNIPDDLEII